MNAPLWVVRPANAGDTNGIVYLWLESFWRSKYAREFRCNNERCGRCAGGSSGNVYQPYSKHAAACAMKRVYWELHEPRVKRLLDRGSVLVAADAQEPSVIWAFACTEGESVVHYTMCKRRFHAEGIGVEILRDLLDGMLERPCTMTHELPDLRREDVRAAGFKIPDTWRHDPYAIERAA